MTLSRVMILAAAAALGLAGTADANGPFRRGGCRGGDCGGSGGFGGHTPQHSTFAGLIGAGRTLPAFQAAPWYLYWPYDAHFLTPAPVSGAFYGAPGAGHTVNPYFPAPAYGGYGPIPGGPAPAAIPSPLPPAAGGPPQ